MALKKSKKKSKPKAGKNISASEKRLYAKKKNSLAAFLRKEEAELSKKFHGFLDAWNAHIKEEIALHKRFAGGRHDFKRHLSQSVEIHKQFLKKLQKS